MPRDGYQDGPFLRLPEGPFDAAIVEGLTASMGNLTRFLSSLASRVLPGGEVLLDVENMQGPRALRLAIEGQPGPFDPLGRPGEPERAVLMRDLLEAADAAGLQVIDLLAVPARDDATQASFATSIHNDGFLAGAFAGGPAPTRYWARVRKAVARAGTALLFGDPAQRDETQHWLTNALPGDWELLWCTGESEAEAVNRGIANARGDVVWLLRAGSQPTDELLQDLLRGVARGAICPANSAEKNGDLNGLMMRRLDLLLAGPLSTEWACAPVAWQELALRMEALGCTPRTSPLMLPADTPRAADAEQARDEAKVMRARWAPLLEATTRPASARPSPEAPWQAEQRAPRLTVCTLLDPLVPTPEAALTRAVATASEVIAVDLGVDAPVLERAAELGVTVVAHGWHEDYAAAFNAGLEQASGDWVLWLNANESLPANASAQLKAVLADPQVAGADVVLRRAGDGEPRMQRVLRLFRRDPEVRFENRARPRIAPSLQSVAARDSTRIATCDLVVECGETAVEASEPLRSRDEQAFRQQLDENADDHYTLYEYAMFLAAGTDTAGQALYSLESAARSIARLPMAEQTAVWYAAEVSAMLALEHERAGRTRRAREVIGAAMRCFVATPNLHAAAARVALRIGRADEAVWHYRRCLAWDDDVLRAEVAPGTTSWAAIVGMADAYLDKGRHERARILLQQASHFPGGAECTALSRCRLHLEFDEFTEALDVLTTHLDAHPDSADACHMATMVLLKLGLVDQAREMGDRAIGLLSSAQRQADVERLREALVAHD